MYYWLGVRYAGTGDRGGVRTAVLGWNALSNSVDEILLKADAWLEVLK